MEKSLIIIITYIFMVSLSLCLFGLFCSVINIYSFHFFSLRLRTHCRGLPPASRSPFFPLSSSNNHSRDGNRLLGLFEDEQHGMCCSITEVIYDCDRRSFFSPRFRATLHSTLRCCDDDAGFVWTALSLRGGFAALLIDTRVRRATERAQHEKMDSR
jgi:hypothetical protein